MAEVEQVVIAGVDTHRDTVHVAVIGQAGSELGDREFPTTPGGYRRVIGWLASHGQVRAVGVEGTASYGAGVTRALHAAGVAVVEVDRPDRRARRAVGKSDPIDAYAAAHAVRSGRARAQAKTQDGAVQAIRSIKVTRHGAVKARTEAMNQLKSLLVGVPAQLRESLRGRPDAALIASCSRLRPGPDRLDPTTAAKTALLRLARRYQQLTKEITDADRDLGAMLTHTAPHLLAVHGVGTDVAATLLTAAGDNPARLTSEAAFARLCGAAPIPASSGRTTRHRLHRGGNRDANRALYVVAVTRMRHDPRTRDYVARRTREGLSKPEIIRCLKRYIAREIHHLLTAPHPLPAAP